MERLLLSATLCFLCFSASGQEKGSSELRLSLGNITTSRIIDATFDAFIMTFTLGHSATRSNYIPAIGAGFRYSAGDRWALTGDVFYETIQKRYYTDDIMDGFSENHYVTFGAGADFHYVNNPMFRVYSGLAAGYTFGFGYYRNMDGERANSSSNYINAQVNFLGMRFGSKFAGHVELGFGYRGLINAGLSLRL